MKAGKIFFYNDKAFIVSCAIFEFSLAGPPDVVSGSEPDRNQLVSLLAVGLVDHLVDGGVPVQRLVLLHIARVAGCVTQILDRALTQSRL